MLPGLKITYQTLKNGGRVRLRRKLMFIPHKTNHNDCRFYCLSSPLLIAFFK